MMIITVDAGHYSKYNKSPVNSNYYEGDIVWDISEKLTSSLILKGVGVINTRNNKDKDLDLITRGKKSAGSDLFISIHTNACGTESVDRVEAIVLSPNNNTTIDNISSDIGIKLVDAVKNSMDLTSSSKVYNKKSSKDRDKNGILDDEYYGVLEGAREVGTPALILECGFHTNKKTTDWLLVDSNRQKLADSISNTIVEYFNLNNKTNGTPVIDKVYNNDISVSDMFNILINDGKFTPESSWAMLGNIQAESGLSSINLQNTANYKINMTDEEYTNRVDNGSYNNFIKDGYGYGLCQWTFWSRKQELYNYTKQHNSKSVGDTRSQLEFLIYELKNNYKQLYDLLKTSRSIDESCKQILLQYERPAVVINNRVDSIAVTSECNKRLKYANELKDKYAYSYNDTTSDKNEIDSKSEGIIDTNNITVTNSLPMTVKIIHDKTPVFKNTNTNSEIVVTVNKNEIYTVIEQFNDLYKLKSGVGYIRIKDTQLYNLNKQRNPFKVPTRTLKYGCVGDDVKWLKFELLQYGLGEFNYNNENFYNMVESAVKKYQKIMGLTVDGIVGTETRNSLMNDGF